MAASFGDGASVRQLGQALLKTAEELSSLTDALSRRVQRLVTEAWSGHSADAFSSDWNGKAGQAHQLAAVCSHVGQVLSGLADAIDGANRQAAAAQQMTGGPASRFADRVAEHKSQRMLSQASGAAVQARAAARSKLAGIQAPRIGPQLTVSQVDAWAAALVPGRVPVFNRLFGALLGDAKDFARRTGLATGWGEAEKMRVSGLQTIGQEAHFAEGIVDGLTEMLRGLGDLLPGPDGGLGRWLWGDPLASQSWDGLSHLAAPFLSMEDPASPSAMEGFGKGFVAWDEWHTDPARATGNVFFNAGSLLVGTKLLSLKTDRALDTPNGITAGEVDPSVPGPPPPSFARPTTEPRPLDSLEEETSGGRSNFMAKGEAFSANLALAGRVDGFHDVIVHGSGTDFGPAADAWDRGTNFSHRVLARLINQDPGYSGGPIRLIACSKAEGATAAQNLANKLGVEVLAATDTVWSFPNGELVVGPTPFAPLGGWEHFYPGKGG